MVWSLHWNFKVKPGQVDMYCLYLSEINPKMSLKSAFAILEVGLKENIRIHRETEQAEQAKQARMKRSRDAEFDELK